MIEIGNGTLTARIDSLGAELVSLRDASGNEVMTDADPAYWTGHAPLLFPIVGRLNEDTLRVDGRDYTMKQHGFARRRVFEVAETSATHVQFVLRDDAETRAVWPFPFELSARYTLDGATLAVEVVVTNPDADRVMWTSFGFHPAFAWPLPGGGAKEAHRIVFERHEPASLAELNAGLIVPAERPTPLDGRTLHLRDALFEEDALIWMAPASRSVRYGSDTGPQLDIAFEGLPTLAIWTKPGAHFICVEPWQGHADPVGFSGELRDKPGVIAIPAGDSRRFAMQVTLRA
ncbi:aldose 1-epimerase family protein [Sphingomonas sp. ST-64]|uniref:Aldose 1-epimerase family protein n=1 Tax=Sphingomonas plantiphila TaxID=3163295 RepID=A0ABW8YLH2_9SPHN